MKATKDNFQVECTQENRKAVIKLMWEIHETNHEGFKNWFYGMSNGHKHFDDCPAKNTPVITIEEAIALFEEKQFPRMMEVEIVATEWKPRMVLGEFGRKYVAIQGEYGNQLENETDYSTTTWLLQKVREIEQRPILELSIDDIAKKFEVSPEQIKIKK